jgi:hypothetical protein
VICDVRQAIERQLGRDHFRGEGNPCGVTASELAEAVERKKMNNENEGESHDIYENTETYDIVKCHNLQNLWSFQIP